MSKLHHIVLPAGVTEQITDIEEDLLSSNQFIFSTTSSILTFNFDTNGLEKIVGKTTEHSYREALGSDARFQKITGFTHADNNTLLVVDGGANCIREVNKRSLKTSVFFGTCLSRQPVPPILNTSKIVADRSAGVYYTSFSGDVYRIWLNKSAEVIASNYEYGALVAMTLDITFNNLYMFTHFDKLIKLNVNDRMITELKNGSPIGFRDGPLANSLFNFPESLKFINADTMLVADSTNNRLRVISEEVVSSICNNDYYGSLTGNISTCFVDQASAIGYIPGKSAVIVGSNGGLYILCLRNSKYLQPNILTTLNTKTLMSNEFPGNYSEHNFFKQKYVGSSFSNIQN